jgi:hypothetical protein
LAVLFFHEDEISWQTVHYYNGQPQHTQALTHIECYRIVFRAPYWSCDGAIEYVFNTIHTYLEIDDGQAMADVDALVNMINLIIGSMASFRMYFLHVSFQDN